MLVKIIGFISAILTTAAFLPQVLKSWKSGSTEDLSPVMFALFTLGVTGWLFYGLFTKDMPIILANGVTVCLAGTIMYFIIRKKKNRKIEHIGIYTDNIEKMKIFYTEVFNASAGKLYTNPKSNFSSYFINFNSGCRLELMSLPDNSAKTGWGHIAISVGTKSEVNNITKKIKQMGFQVSSEPRYTGDGYYESVILDPEGNKIEITI
jgi:lactoylglutathione lyase